MAIAFNGRDEQLQGVVAKVDSRAIRMGELVEGLR